MAHALVMQVKLPQDANSEEAQRMLDEIVIPLAKSQTGFQKGTWMHDGGNGIGVIVFATAENAEAAKGTLKPPPEGPQLVSSIVYEVAAEA